MAIINVTPDSFFEQSRVSSIDDAVSKALIFQEQGADLLDIGAASTRPFADPVSPEEELKRLEPIIKELKNQTSLPISIDTFHPFVAKKALELGANIINDISGCSHLEMQAIVKDFNVPIIVMHMQGTPQTMQIKPFYKNGVVNEVMTFFKRRVDELLKVGIKKQNIILDPGIGFGKTVDDCCRLTMHLQDFKALGFPILYGASRKSFLQKIINKPVSEQLSTTLSVNTIALMAKVDYIRVHDICPHRDIIDLIDYLSAVDNDG